MVESHRLGTLKEFPEGYSGGEDKRQVKEDVVESSVRGIYYFFINSENALKLSGRDTTIHYAGNAKVKDRFVRS